MVLWHGRMLETSHHNWEVGDKWYDTNGKYYEYDGEKWKEVKDGVGKGA